MNGKVLSIVAIMLVAGLRADIKVSDVEVFSGYPWKEIVVGYTISGTDDNADGIRLTATDKSTNKSYVAKTLEGAIWNEGRHFMRWNAAAEGVKLSSANVVFEVSVRDCGSVQLWENGPFWAQCNVGATKPEAYGYYFWWGDTIGYYDRDSNGWYAVDGSSKSFAFGESACSTYGLNDATLRSRGYIDSAGNLASKFDAATQYLGTPWRMPTAAEWEALKSNCTTVWKLQNGVHGLLVTGKGAYSSKSIFLPAAGYGSSIYRESSDQRGEYWSSTPHTANLLPLGANTLEFYKWMDNLAIGQDTSNRYTGYPVRPVREAVK